MALVILDPNLEGPAGHHLAYDLAIAREARARGEAVTIVANRRFPGTEAEGVRVLPHFTATTYAVEHQDPVTGAADDWRHFNDLLQADLALLPRGETPPDAAVLVPTVTENHLAGFVGWMKSFDPIEAPLFLIHLMFPSGVTVDAGGAMVVEDPLRALFYRLAERAAREAGPEVHLFASGGQHAAEFGALFGRAVPPHPLPIRPEPSPARQAPARRALVFAGDARIDKGVALLPALIPRLAAAHPDWTFVAHVNGAAAWGEAKAAAEAVAALAGTRPNVEVAAGRLSPEDYLALARGVDVALFPYDPALCRRKSSGVLWEAVSLGTPVVVPEGTWLENEARHWGAGHVASAGHDAAAIAEAFAAALPRIDALAAQSAEAGKRYRAANGAAALIDQVAALWVRHKAAASLVERPRVMAVDLARLDAGWHRLEALDGQPIRWSQREPTIAFDWPFEEPWELELRLPSFLGTEQFEKAEVVGSETPVSLSWQREGHGARLLARGAGQGRARPRIAFRLRLPQTYRPANETRDLGILVTAMRVGPATGARAAAARTPERPAARILDAAGAGEGWPREGELRAEPDRPCMLAFRLRGDTGGAPPAVALRIAGAAARLRFSVEGVGTWLGIAMLSPALLRAAGDPAAWTLVAENGSGLALESVSASALAGTTRPLDEAPAPAVPAAGMAAPRLRWDLTRGVGPDEGPFPDLGLPAGVRWVVAREALLVVEAGAEAAARLTLGYRSLVPRQDLRVTVNGGAAMPVDLVGGGLKAAAAVTIDLALRPGENEVALAFGAAVREPGTGRELVLLIERAEVEALPG